MMFQLLFIRHGESIANILKNTLYGLHFFAFDSPLSENGIKESTRLQNSLLKVIKQEFSEQPYSLGSSHMIRAQETAFYMLGTKKIDVYPHIGEPGLTLDNIGLDKMLQIAYFNTTNREIINFLGIDFRDSFNKSCWLSFLLWLQENRELLQKGSDGVFRAVIFTHSHFLHSLSPQPDGLLPNNQGLITSVFSAEEKPNFRRLFI